MEKKFRNVRINFNKNMQQYSKRESCRRSINYLYVGMGKDKKIHRNVKRSIKHFEKIALNNILYDNQQRSLINLRNVQRLSKR
jgi:hypothetical protein